VTTRDEVIAAMARTLHDLLLRGALAPSFTGQVSLELNYAEGQVKTAYIDTREGVRLSR
jgi:hypothetical protein